MSPEETISMDSITCSMARIACNSPQVSMQSEAGSRSTQYPSMVETNDNASSIEANSGIYATLPDADLQSSHPDIDTVQKNTPAGVSDYQSTELTMAESKPLTHFHPFPRLPIELRLKMYHIAMQEPRLIGIEWIRNENSYHVVPSSRTPPALFHLCQESRAEASTIYEKRVFQSPWASIRNRNNEAPYIWYNAGVDIILFGDKCSSDTVLAFIRDRHVVQRLAVNTNGKHAIDVLSAFHGSRNAMLPTRYACDGCSGLKEVFVIVDSRLWNGETCRSNPRVSLRQATSSGSTEAEVRSLRGFESAITSCIIPSSYLYSRFEKWHGGKGPKFKFVSFAPIVMDNDPRVYDGMSVGRIPAKFFLQQQKKLLDDLEQRTGCSILISVEDNDSLTTTEVGFHGSTKAVEVAKTEFKNYFDSYPSRRRMRSHCVED